MGVMAGEALPTAVRRPADAAPAGSAGCTGAAVDRGRLMPALRRKPAATCHSKQPVHFCSVHLPQKWHS